MEPMIFFNIGWMKRYQGIAEDDRPQRGGSWVQKHGWDHAMLNFQPFEGRYYGYGQPMGDQLKLERLGAPPGADRLDGVTVIWVAQSPQGGSVLVGWYRHASLFRSWQQPPKGSGREHDGTTIGFYATGKVEDGVLVPEDARKFPVPRGKGGMGQANVWYADKPEHEAFKKQVMEYIASGGELLPPPPARAWVFQANPNFYDIDRALCQLTEMSWLVNQHKAEIREGDNVFIWRSGVRAGIIGEATALTPPTEMEELPEELEFALQKEKFRGLQLRVRLKIQRRLAPALARSVLKEDPRLIGLSILTGNQGTNFAVSPEEEVAILDLLDEDQAHRRESDGSEDQTVRVWIYAPGPNAQYWEEFYRQEIIAIGWDEMGDLRQYPDPESMAEKLGEVYRLGHRPVNDSKTCFDFVHTMKPGDRVFAKRGREEVVGYGTVKGDYEYRPDRPAYRSVRRVLWERRGKWKCDRSLTVKTLTDYTQYPDTTKYLTNLIAEDRPIEDGRRPPPPPYTVDDASKGAALDRAEFKRYLELWRAKKNLILQGPPGVGKTFLARRLAYSLIGYELPSQVGAVQFHQSYSYEDFVQGYRPAENGFARKDGVFVRFCKRASLDQDSVYVFIIDEINRSNLSKVFGELLMLIEADKRGSKNSIALTYSTSEEEQFYVPANVYLLGMMNTADRSLALVDYALRRRFAFVELHPLFGQPEFDAFLTNAGTDPALAAAVSARLVALNQAIAKDQNLGPGFMIGHSYFCGNGSALTAEAYASAVRHEILPLLREYWFDDPGQVEHWTQKLEARFD